MLHTKTTHGHNRALHNSNLEFTSLPVSRSSNNIAPEAPTAQDLRIQFCGINSFTLIPYAPCVTQLNHYRRSWGVTMAISIVEHRQAARSLVARAAQAILDQTVTAARFLVSH